MTMPHLANCPHREASWCLDCVKELGEECIRWTAKAERLATELSQEKAEYSYMQSCRDGQEDANEVVEADRARWRAEAMAARTVEQMKIGQDRLVKARSGVAALTAAAKIVDSAEADLAAARAANGEAEKGGG